MKVTTDSRSAGEKARLSFLPPLAIFLAVFAVYSQTGSYEFLRFDDQDYTFLCPFVKDGLSWANVKTAFTSFTHAAIWMPLTYISYMLDISLFGPGMGAHHLVNAAIHAANSVLFYLLLVNIFGKCNIFIFLSTLFWALHPMRVEPVAWIAGRKELLCAFFVLLGLLSVVRRRFGQTIKPILCCLAACMSKPTGMCFPFLALCVAAMSRAGGQDNRRVGQEDNRRVGQEDNRRVGQEDNRRVGQEDNRTIGQKDSRPSPALTTNHYQLTTNHYQLPTILPTFPIAIATGLIAVYSQTHADGYDVRTLFTAPFSVRALNALKSLGLYIFKTFIPFDLHIDCRWPTPDLPVDGWGAILAAVIGLLVLGMWFAKGMAWWRAGGQDNRRVGQEDNRTTGQKDSRPSPALPTNNQQLTTNHYQLTTILFFLFALAPTLGIFGSFGRETRADRFMYIPSMAISMLLVAMALRRVEEAAPYHAHESPPGRAGSPLPAAELLLLLLCHSIYTFRLIPTFRNDYTAFSRVLACDPIHPRALSHVASEECARFRDFDSGIKHYRDSLACEWNRDTACKLAFALATRGRKEDIPDIRALGESTGIAKNPETDRKALMTEALGMAALKDHRWLDAVPFFAAAIRAPARLYPPDDAYARLGVALANGGRRKEAEELFASLARPGAARESVRAFAERSLEQLASSPNGGIMLFY